MQKSIVWEGLQYDTEEHCNVNFLDTGIIVRSEIEGWAGLKALYAEYTLTLNVDWTVRKIEIHFTTGLEEHSYNFTRHASGHWTDATGTVLPQFGECRFVDISLTPFTNTLAIKGIAFTNNVKEQVSVLYFDILANQVHEELQQYMQIAPDKYLFENAEGDFTAEIDVDDDGFVTRYPNLFTMLKPL